MNKLQVRWLYTVQRDNSEHPGGGIRRAVRVAVQLSDVRAAVSRFPSRCERTERPMRASRSKGVVRAVVEAATRTHRYSSLPQHIARRQYMHNEDTAAQRMRMRARMDGWLRASRAAWRKYLHPS